jgi:hypothetical protein
VPRRAAQAASCWRRPALAPTAASWWKATRRSSRGRRLIWRASRCVCRARPARLVLIPAQSANSASLSSFMDLLPPAAGPSATSSTPQIRNPATSGGRRLGTGRPRPAGAPGAKRAAP